MFQKNQLEYQIIPNITKNYIKTIEDKFIIIQAIEEELSDPKRLIDIKRVDYKNYFEQIEFLESIPEGELDHLPIYSKTNEVMNAEFYFNMILVYFISVWEAFNNDIFENLSISFSKLSYNSHNMNLLNELDKVIPNIHIITKFPEYLILKEFYHRRNSIVHNNGKADAKYNNLVKRLQKYLTIKPRIDPTTNKFLTNYEDINFLYSTLRKYILDIYSKSLEYIRKNK